VSNPGRRPIRNQDKPAALLARIAHGLCLALASSWARRFTPFLPLQDGKYSRIPGCKYGQQGRLFWFCR